MWMWKNCETFPFPINCLLLQTQTIKFLRFLHNFPFSICRIFIHEFLGMSTRFSYFILTFFFFLRKFNWSKFVEIYFFWGLLKFSKNRNASLVSFLSLLLLIFGLLFKVCVWQNILGLFTININIWICYHFCENVLGLYILYTEKKLCFNA